MSFSAVNGVQAILVRRTIFAAALWKSGQEFAIIPPPVEELGMSPLEVQTSTARTRGIAVFGVMWKAFSCGNWSLGANGFVHWARRVESLGNCSL
jgi:hypothetical protein